jgi:putative membrane protein
LALVGNFLAGLYPWTKALHIIAMVAWMAGLLYLPRLFVYHCEVSPGSETSERFKVMEYRLYRFIMTPAMLATFALGICLALTPGLVDWSSGWFYVKLVCVLGLAGVHGMMSRWRKDFLADRNRRPQKYFRVMNEVPTLLMIVAVIMVAVKPF